MTLFAIILATGRWQNGLFGLVIVANSAIGIVQELRAKRTLDRLTLLNATTARAVRDGDVTDIELADIVADDLIELRSGDQVPADGVVADSDGLEIDESLLTGESDPVAKQEGADVRSGSLVVAGRGRFQATAVGADAYATRLAAEAKQSQMPHSELVAGTNRLLRWISLLMVVVAPVLLWSQFRSKDNHGWQDSITGTVAALVGMVPEGLVLLTSLAFTLATVTLARKQTLVQQLPAVEGLARVDVICLDKTGTLTYGDIVFERLQLLPGAAEPDVRQALALSATGPDTNATSQALSAVFPSTSWTRTGGIAFSSARKWSAVTAEGHGTWVLGAPEMVLPAPTDERQRAARSSADAAAAQGNRVLLLADALEELATANADDTSHQLPRNLMPAALVILAERLREDAAETLKYFLDQGVQLKVISGDNPRTVGAVACRVGIPGITGPSDSFDARELPDDIDELADIVETHAVFGRISPQQKRAVVKALQSRGHVVAMTGDGVNDALALKDADIGVAMGNGSPATRAVAQLVLLDGKFAHLPDVLAEGRRVIANIERAANLFLDKNMYALVLALIAAVTLRAYPLAPIQLTLISTVTIGFPGAVLALAPNTRRYLPGFLTPGAALRRAGRTTHRALRVRRLPRHTSAGLDCRSRRRSHHRCHHRAHHLALDPPGPGPPARQLEARAGGDDGRNRRADRLRAGARPSVPLAADPAATAGRRCVRGRRRFCRRIDLPRCPVHRAPPTCGDPEVGAAPGRSREVMVIRVRFERGSRRRNSSSAGCMAFAIGQGSGTRPGQAVNPTSIVST